VLNYFNKLDCQAFQYLNFEELFFTHGYIFCFMSYRDSPESQVLALQYAAPRSLNSDISYFGVGGKQAVFFIGTSVRVSDVVYLNCSG
jgi:hypothetical protein